MTFLNGYIHPNNFKNKKTSPWGFAPNPTSLARPQGQVANPIHYPYGECWVDSRRQRVKCERFVALGPSPSPWG